MTSTESPSDYAITLTAKRCFHQWTTYEDPGGSGKRCKVSFATTSNFDGPGAQKMPTIFIHGPMSASRYFVIWYDHLAVTMGVRLMFMDRPGFGLHARTDPSRRMANTLAATQAILKHLKVPYTAFVAVSAGALYLINTLVSPSLRPFLHPRHPYAAAIVPWVHPDFSHCGLMATAAKLPQSWISSFGGLQKFMVQNVVPTVGWSGGVFDAVGAALKPGGKKEMEIQDGKDKAEREEYKRCHGVDEEYKDVLDSFVIKCVLAEDYGVNDEAPFNLRKSIPSSYWNAAADYPGFVSELASLEAGRQSDLRSTVKHASDATAVSTQYAARDPPTTTDDNKDTRFQFHAFFATSDMMIGDGGQTYFDSLFGNDNVKPHVSYTSEVIPDSNHESVVGASKGAIEKVFQEVKTGWEDGL